MIWGELLKLIHEKRENDCHFLSQSVTVWDMDEGEYYPVEMFDTCEADDILDAGHSFLGIKSPTEEGIM